MKTYNLDCEHQGIFCIWDNKEDFLKLKNLEPYMINNRWGGCKYIILQPLKSESMEGIVIKSEAESLIERGLDLVSVDDFIKIQQKLLIEQNLNLVRLAGSETEEN